MSSLLKIIVGIVALFFMVLMVFGFVFVDSLTRQSDPDLENEVAELSETVNSLEDKILDLENEGVEMENKDEEEIVKDRYETKCIKAENYSPDTILGDECFISDGKDLFESARYGFTFEYPSDWFVQEKEGRVSVSNEDVETFLEMSENGVYITIDESSNPNQMTTEQYIDGLAKNYPEEIQFYDEKRIVMHGVVNAIQRIEDAQQVQETETWYGIGTYSAFTDKIYSIESASFNKKSYESYEKNYLDLVDSFKFN